MRTLFSVLSGLALVGMSLAQSSLNDTSCTCTSYVYALKTTTYTFNQIDYSRSIVPAYTATQKKKTATTTTTTSILNTYVYTQTFYNTATITAHVKSTTTLSTCADFTTPDDYSSFSDNSCDCPKTTTTRFTLTEAHTITKTSTYYTATVTASGTKSPTKTITETLQASSVVYLNIYVLTTSTSTVTAYRKTKTVAVPAFATPDTFKLQSSGQNLEDYGTDRFAGYMYEEKLSYPPQFECLSYGGDSNSAGIFHFTNTTTLAQGGGTCTSKRYNSMDVKCADGTWSIPTAGYDVPLKCFVDCFGYLHCYHDIYYVTWYADLGYECVYLDYSLDPRLTINMKVVPV